MPRRKEPVDIIESSGQNLKSAKVGSRQVVPVSGDEYHEDGVTPDHGSGRAKTFFKSLFKAHSAHNAAPTATPSPPSPSKASKSALSDDTGYGASGVDVSRSPRSKGSFSTGMQQAAAARQSKEDSPGDESAEKGQPLLYSRTRFTAPGATGTSEAARHSERAAPSATGSLRDLAQLQLADGSYTDILEPGQARLAPASPTRAKLTGATSQRTLRTHPSMLRPPGAQAQGGPSSPSHHSHAADQDDATQGPGRRPRAASFSVNSPGGLQGPAGPGGSMLPPIHAGLNQASSSTLMMSPTGAGPGSGGAAGLQQQGGSGAGSLVSSLHGSSYDDEAMGSGSLVDRALSYVKQLRADTESDSAEIVRRSKSEVLKPNIQALLAGTYDKWTYNSPGGGGGRSRKAGVRADAGEERRLLKMSEIDHGWLRSLRHREIREDVSSFVKK